MMHKNQENRFFFYNREINLNVCILMNRESWNSDFSWPLLVDQTDAVTPSSYPRRRSRHPSSRLLSHTTTPERDGGAARPPHCRRGAPPREPRPPPPPPHPPRIAPPLLLRSPTTSFRRPGRCTPAPNAPAASSPPRPHSCRLCGHGRLRGPDGVRLCSISIPRPLHLKGYYAALRKCSPIYFFWLVVRCNVIPDFSIWCSHSCKCLGF